MYTYNKLKITSRLDKYQTNFLHYWRIFLPTCLPQDPSPTHKKKSPVYFKASYLHTKWQNFWYVQIESICRWQKLNFVKVRVENIVVTGETESRKHCSNRKNCWLLAFSLCPTTFSKSRFQGQVKSRLFGTGTQDIYITDSIIRNNLGHTNIKWCKNIHRKFSPNMAFVVHFSPFDGRRVSSPNPKKNLSSCI